MQSLENTYIVLLGLINILQENIVLPRTPKESVCSALSVILRPISVAFFLVRRAREKNSNAKTEKKIFFNSKNEVRENLTRSEAGEREKWNNLDQVENTLLYQIRRGEGGAYTNNFDQTR